VHDEEDLLHGIVKVVRAHPEPIEKPGDERRVAPEELFRADGLFGSRAGH
jgi:hypothetical protein